MSIFSAGKHRCNRMHFPLTHLKLQNLSSLPAALLGRDLICSSKEHGTVFNGTLFYWYCVYSSFPILVRNWLLNPIKPRCFLGLLQHSSYAVKPFSFVFKFTADMKSLFHCFSKHSLLCSFKCTYHDFISLRDRPHNPWFNLL